jgi:hypothetical protein
MQVLSVVAALALLTLLPGAAQAQQVYRCQAADGTVSFQQQPCLGAGQRVQVGQINTAAAFTPNPELQRSAQVRDAVSRGAILAGMTADEVHQSRGLPQRASRTSGAWGTRDQLVYRYPDGSTLRVDLLDGQVDAVTTSSGPPRRTLQPCYSELEIRNAGLGSQSSVLPAEERERRRREADRMARCRR